MSSEYTIFLAEVSTEEKNSRSGKRKKSGLGGRRERIGTKGKRNMILLDCQVFLKLETSYLGNRLWTQKAPLMLFQS